MGALAAAEHRPWPLPRRPWVLAQTWRDLLFAHWPLPAASLRGHVPAGLSIDTFEGSGWLGLAAFRMTGVRLRGCPPLPRLSAFPELNLRTYVTAGDRPGVWFLSLDAGSALAVALARRWFHLPYRHALMAVAPAGERVVFAARRPPRGAPAAELVAAYGPAGDARPARPGTLDHWLTERYCLYAGDRGGRLLRGEIHHAPWPLQPAQAEIARNSVAGAVGIALPAAPPLLHFARRLDVVAWPVRPVPAR